MIGIKRQAIINVLNNINPLEPIMLPYSKEELKEIFFNKKVDEEENIYYEINRTMFTSYQRLDMSNVDFTDVKVEGTCFINMVNIKINPQKVYKKSLKKSSLCGVEFVSDDINETDLFEGVDIRGTNFSSSTGAKINPQTIYLKDLTETKLTNVDFTGFSFDGVKITGTDFTKSIGVKLDPNKIVGLNFTVDFSDVELLDLYSEGTGYEAAMKKARNYQDLQQRVKETQEQVRKDLEKSSSIKILRR